MAFAFSFFALCITVEFLVLSTLIQESSLLKQRIAPLPNVSTSSWSSCTSEARGSKEIINMSVNAKHDI